MVASLTSREGSLQRLHWPLVWTAVVAALLYWGMHAHLERYITPKRGFGYWLGISGGSMMVLLLIYSARKRASWLRWIGSIPAWFHIHMVLGVVGPILILFHSNFRLGASNSNVALICMLLVAGSGVVGRYIYTRLHARMDGHQDTLEQLKAVGERLRGQTNTIAFVPGLVETIERVEKRFMESPEGAVTPLLYALTGGARSFIARWLIRRQIKRAVGRAIESRATTGGAAVIARHAAQIGTAASRAITAAPPVVARHAAQIGTAASRYAERRLEAGRRAAEYQTYARLFSYWHVLHIPLFYMMLIAAIVHIVAVNLY